MKWVINHNYVVSSLIANVRHNWILQLFLVEARSFLRAVYIISTFPSGSFSCGVRQQAVAGCQRSASCCSRGTRGVWRSYRRSSDDSRPAINITHHVSVLHAADRRLPARRRHPTAYRRHFHSPHHVASSNSFSTLPHSMTEQIKLTNSCR